MTVTVFAPGDAIAYVAPSALAVVLAPPDDSTLGSLLSADSLVEAVALFDDPTDGVVVRHDGAELQAATRGRRLGVSVDGSPIDVTEPLPGAPGWTVAGMPNPSTVRVGRRDLGAGVEPGFSVGVGVVPVSAVERRLEASSTPADPFSSVFGSTVDRSVEAAAVRDQLGHPAPAILVAADGRRVCLDRPVLLGRNPRVVERAERDARMVRLHHPDVSRRHALVVADRWSVVVTDLGSVNGTTIEVPDRRSERLVPDRCRPLPFGSILRLGREAAFAVEALA